MSTTGAENGQPEDGALPFRTALTDTPLNWRRVVTWAMYDWGTQPFNTIIITFVFAVYLTSSSFGDINSTTSALALATTISGLFIAVLAPVLGQAADRSGRTVTVLRVLTALIVVLSASLFFIKPSPAYLVWGLVLFGIGSLVSEIAGVTYNATIEQVASTRSVGRVSGFGWGMGYVGGIVLLILLLALFIQSFGSSTGNGLLNVPFGTDGAALDVRLAILASALWFAVFALPVLRRVPEIPARARQNRVSFFGSYVVLFGTIRALARRSPQVLLFLLASAVFRDGLAAVFTFGAIIAAQVFGFSATEVIYFAVAANLVAGVGTFAAGWLDDRIGAKNIILGSLVGLVLAGTAVLFVGDGQAGFWVSGLMLCVFVGPVQSSSRSFLARITPPGREGEIFGLYATTGRAVSFLAPGLFTLFVGVTGDTRFGIIGIVVVLLAGLLLMLPVKAVQSQIE